MARKGYAAVAAALIGLLAAAAGATPASALSTADFLASLSSSEVNEFQAWRSARRTFERELDAYWDDVETKRSGRKKKRTAKVPFARSDYVMTLPPSYGGPKLNDALQTKYERFLKQQESSEPEPAKEILALSDYLNAAKRVYNFTPERISEKEFKQRYARHAVELGLTKEQVVRIYALETGGIGTYDMQAGIHPIKKTGRPISSALGYAQLLDANSVNELAQSGPAIIERLTRLMRNPGNPQARTDALKRKIAVVKKMYANVKRVPYEWSRHQAYAKTDAGMGVHVLNLDGDIGPMLQAVKLKGLKDFAAKTGRMSLTGGEMEMMNLAGPATGLEMLQPPGTLAPTANFFARRAYYVNKMVIGLDGAGLLAELNRRMDQAVKTPGSIEFAEAFDMAGRRANR